MTEPQVVETVEQIEARCNAAAEVKLEIWKTKELASIQEKNNAVIEQEIQKLYKKIQDEQKPLDKTQIQTLVDQEYAEIKVKLFVENAEGVEMEQIFVLRELPQSVERKFYRQFKERLRDKSSEIAAFAQKAGEQSFEKNIVSFLDSFDGGFDILADAAVLILNPKGKRPEITAEWVANNISANRLYSIVMAQVEVNKLRDFFSRLFQSGLKLETLVNPPNIRQLQQLAR